MKILVATGETHTPDGHFNWCDEDEPVLLPLGVCDNGDTCGCAHAWVGLNTTKGTTRAKVVEVAMTVRAFKETIRDRLVQQGYIPAGRSIDCADVRTNYLHVHQIAARFEVGTVLKYTNQGPVALDPAPQEA
jgi:hypothetical protein